MKVDVPVHIPAAEELGRVHFIGIAGAGLSGIARVMATRGVPVSGSDQTDSATLESLRALGVRCWVGHDSHHVEAVDTVVVSTAVREDNPEVVRAQELGLRLWPRSAGVQSVLVGRRSVVVTGTHGKTTTTSMLATALLLVGAEPSYAIGSTLNASGLNAGAGRGDIFVVEGDESDGAILAYTPTGAIITNVDVDHLDHFGTAEAYAEVFVSFLDTIASEGFVVCCVDDSGAARVADEAENRGIRTIRVGVTADADIQATSCTFVADSSRFDVRRGDILLGQVVLQVPGQHYIVDAVAALAAGLELGFDFGPLADGLAAFRGSARRMESKGTADGVRVYDSYAHHPAEITADLSAARGMAGDGRLVVCFQPHLFSRTKQFAISMGEALGRADEVVVMDVYASREVHDPTVSGADVAVAVPLGKTQVAFVPRWDDAAAEVARRTAPGDLVITLGAGDVTQIGSAVLLILAQRSRGAS
ncbi:MAG: UDP-N-acetylmuramate--L-alanine ligase [Propionibacteriales bacterium]|nr:UDP-N-acetylmuramate--L-alanine ligase [Propionibacteriales bacterium]